jgi:hypothetical protein
VISAKKSQGQEKREKNRTIPFFWFQESMESSGAPDTRPAKLYANSTERRRAKRQRRQKRRAAQVQAALYRRLIEYAMKADPELRGKMMALRRDMDDRLRQKLAAPERTEDAPEWTEDGIGAYQAQAHTHDNTFIVLNTKVTTGLDKLF